MSVVPEQERQPPVELAKRCAEINKDRLVGSSGMLELYWTDNMWKFRVRHRRHRNIIMMEHIRQESFAHNDHWVYLAVSAIDNGYHRGLVDGKLNCVDRMVNDACSKLGVSKDMYLNSMEEKRTIG